MNKLSVFVAFALLANPSITQASWISALMEAGGKSAGRAEMQTVVRAEAYGAGRTVAQTEARSLARESTLAISGAEARTISREAATSHIVGSGARAEGSQATFGGLQLRKRQATSTAATTERANARAWQAEQEANKRTLANNQAQSAAFQEQQRVNAQHQISIDQSNRRFQQQQAEAAQRNAATLRTNQEAIEKHTVDQRAFNAQQVRQQQRNAAETTRLNQQTFHKSQAENAIQAEKRAIQEQRLRDTARANDETFAKKQAENAAHAERHNLSAAQSANLKRFEGKLPANATATRIHDLPNGGRAFQADSAAQNIPGSFAQYEKQVDVSGKTMQVTKTTYGPNGEIIHVKYKDVPSK